MRKFFVCFLILPLFLIASEVVSPSFTEQAIAATEQGMKDIAILNRPLIKVNGKTISQIDVIKKMNAFLYKNYPEVIGHKIPMYQYYSSSWRRTLDDIINDELMLLEAEAKEITVTVGDVREEVEARFGPNIMASLEKIGMSLDEARKFVETEMLVQRVMWMNVHQKAVQKATPKKIKESYFDYVKANPPKDTWVYQVLSIKGDSRGLAQKMIETAASAEGDLEARAKVVKEAFAEEPDMPNLNISDEFSIELSKLSDQHKQALEDLKPNQFSAPIEQVSRRDNSTVWRLFYLKDKLHQEPPPFEIVSEQLKNQILQQFAVEYAKEYFTALREKYHLSDAELKEMIPADYEPFALR